MGAWENLGFLLGVKVCMRYRCAPCSKVERYFAWKHVRTRIALMFSPGFLRIIRGFEKSSRALRVFQRMVQKTDQWAHNPELEDEESQFKPLTAQEAQAWRERHGQRWSVWRLVGLQCVVALAVALLAWMLAGVVAGCSAGYGGLTVVLPAMVFARAALARLFGWELVKWVLCIAMLVAAPRLIKDLDWLALLAGMVIVMKTYGLALLAGRARTR